jgi:DNA-directed RNA polymerase specialized sigma24 family protein
LAGSRAVYRADPVLLSILPATVVDRLGEEVVDIRNRSVVGGIVVGVSSEVSVGEEKATLSFAAFYAEQQRGAVQLAWLLTHDASASEDIAHDAFAAVFQRFNSLDRPAAYLRTTIINRVYESGRRVGRERRRIELVGAAESSFTDGPTGGLEDVVAKLALKPRTAIVLRYWAGLTDREIAQAMQIRPGTARSMISRALEQLRKDMS